MTVPRLRILVVSPELPYPPTWGFGLRVYQLVRGIAQRHDVTLLTYGTDADRRGIEHLRSKGIDVNVVAPPAPRFGRKRLAQLCALPASAPYAFTELRSEAMQETLRKVLNERQFDLVQIESAQMSTFDVGQVRLVLDEHNIEYELLQRSARAERVLTRKAYNWLEFLKFRRAELRAWALADGCAVTSTREERLLRQHIRAKPIAVVPNGVDVGPLCDPDESRLEEQIVFVGLMRYRPNVDAVEFFAREVFPGVLRRHPAATLTIVGASAPEALVNAVGPRVHFTGYVPDVRPLLASAAVVIAPLRMGSGTRLKVLEALAAAKPTVSTSIGCEGLDVRHGRDLLVADDASSFADAVTLLLEDRELGASLGRSGRELVRNEYGWESAVRRLEALHRAVIAPVTNTEEESRSPVFSGG